MTFTVGQWVRCRYGTDLPEYKRIGKVTRVERESFDFQKITVRYLLPDLGTREFTYPTLVRSPEHMIMPDAPTEQEAAEWILDELSR